MVLRFVFFLLLFVFTYFPVYSWEGILWRTLRPGKNLDMMLIDDFEEKIKWNLANSLPVASILRFAEINPADRGINNPGSDKNENLYRDELDLLSESARIHGRTFSKTQKYSQELAVFFANPGIDYQFMQAPEKDRHFLQGRPVAISLWVMGKGKRHALYAIFSNRVRQKIQIKMGNLDFSGWKRFEV
ncbi:MAG: flagellar filament outer layer protein FlaA, partial [Spirochaetia bacterium]|nr:flagellar filament outer layer protein FlaA [Spirochaetia bacterium]